MDTEEALVVSSFSSVTFNRMPRSAPGKGAILSHNMARGNYSSEARFWIRANSVVGRISLVSKL